MQKALVCASAQPSVQVVDLSVSLGRRLPALPGQPSSNGRTIRSINSMDEEDTREMSGTRLEPLASRGSAFGESELLILRSDPRPDLRTGPIGWEITGTRTTLPFSRAMSSYARQMLVRESLHARPSISDIIHSTYKRVQIIRELMGLRTVILWTRESN